MRLIGVLATNSMRSAIIILLITISRFSYGQFVKPSSVLSIPIEIKTLVPNKITALYEVDFSGDGIKDYIAECDDNKGSFYEYWITSDHKIFNIAYLPQEIHYRFVGNLDNDPELEIVRATGYEDGIDYYIAELDSQLQKEKILFFFNPIILKDHINYWAYPWDIEDIQLKESKIHVSVDHNILRYGEISNPSEQTMLPVLFFNGTSSQPHAKENEINSTTYLSLNQLIGKVFNK